MAKNLVIVESPAKAKTIEKFLGKDYRVESSFGHIADLPSKELGVDVEGDFSPTYIVSSDKKAVVKSLKALSKKAETVWLASDEDREGEAIAWHLKDQLNLKDENTKRIVFHEITKKAILKAIDNPREIDYGLVDAQQARRVLDRLVGYELSPILWRKVKTGLSAGRVQSVAVRLIVEKETSIKSFVPEKSYKVNAVFYNNSKKNFKAAISKGFDTEKEALKFLEDCSSASFNVDTLIKKPAKKSPTPPFTTSTLQQEAARKLGFSVARTMNVAQRLYEAGHITYMRTDSVNLSDDAKKAIQAEVTSSYGEQYSKPRVFKSKSKGAQEAHEAIRATNFENHTINSESDWNRLYSLIWKRAVASQMSDAEFERTDVRIANDNNDKIFTANGEIITFEGFLKVYLEGTDNEDEEQAGILPALKEGELLDYENIIATEKYTKAPYRYTEASLVKKLEELGIGRPSTYSPTISTIQKRGYVDKPILEGVDRDYVKMSLVSGNIKTEKLIEITGNDKGKLIPTDIGEIVTNFLVTHFDSILDYGFTAKVESDFDEIAQGNIEWKKNIKDFYKDFHTTVKDVSENAERESGERVLGEHPETGKTILVRLGKFGPMVQMGDRDDEDKIFASLQKNQTLSTISFKEALDLFLLPKDLGSYKEEEVLVSNGRFGPYVKFGTKYVSIPRGENPLDITYERAVELIDEKEAADAPIAHYEELPVQKAIGRFGPYIKWNSIFINISKKYDYDNLSQEDIETLIEDKKRKEIEKVIHNWEDQGIRVEKARWGRFNIIKGKLKIELPKTTDAPALTLEEVEKMIEAKKPKKKTVKKAKTKKK